MGPCLSCCQEPLRSKASSSILEDQEMILRSEINEPKVEEDEEGESEDKALGSDPKEKEKTKHTPEQVFAFNDAISHTVPTAIPADLDTTAELEVGRVLLYRKKPKANVSWCKQALDFARDEDGSPVSVFDLLSEQSKETALVERVRETKVAFTNRTNEEYVYRSTTDVETTMKLSVDFGSVFEVSSNLYALVNSLELPVNANHPVVQQAEEKGGVVMVISKVYQSERASVQLGGADQEGGIAQWSPVFSNPTPTNLAYQLLKLKINENGILKPMISVGLTPRSLAKINIDVLKRMVSVSETEEAPPEAAPAVGTGMNEVDYGQDIHFHHGRRHIEVFHSTCYAGMIEESSEFVKALVENGELQKELIDLVTSPNQWDNLDKLVNHLYSVQEASVQRGEKGIVFPTEFKDMARKMSYDQDTREEEIKSLLITAEAFKEFNAGAMKCITELTPQQRDNILTLIKQLPLGSARHVFTHKSFPDSNPVYYQFLRKMGFGDSQGHLDHTSDPDTMDKLGAGITAVLAMANKQT